MRLCCGAKKFYIIETIGLFIITDIFNGLKYRTFTYKTNTGMTYINQSEGQVNRTFL